MKFYEELSECLGSEPKVALVITLESADNGTEHSDSEEESTDSAYCKGKPTTKETEVLFFSIRNAFLHETIQCQT